MALPKLETVLNKISSLATAIRGQASDVKASFDHDVNIVKDYINDTLIPAIENTFETKDNITNNRKLSATGDFTGTWNGLTPTETESGLQATVNEHTLQIATKAASAQPAWISPTLLNGWVNVGTGYTVAGYFKDTLGFVHIKAVIKSGVTTAGTAIFTLPTGYRPSDTHSFAASCFSVSNDVLATVLVRSDGNLVTAYVPSNTSLMIEITYKAEA